MVMRFSHKSYSKAPPGKEPLPERQISARSNLWPGSGLSEFFCSAAICTHWISPGFYYDLQGTSRVIGSRILGCFCKQPEGSPAGSRQTNEVCNDGPHFQGTSDAGPPVSKQMAGTHDPNSVSIVFQRVASHHCCRNSRGISNRTGWESRIRISERTSGLDLF